MKAFIFPGQGIQRVGMGKDLFALYPDLVQQADEVLGYSITQLCTQDPHNRLNQTEFTQPAIYVVSYLSYLDQMAKNDTPDYFIGHSVGEYAALTAAGALDFATGLAVVKKRAQLMSQAHSGAMAAILNSSLDAVKQLLKAGNFTRLYIANLNSPSQIVIGGFADELDHCLELCKQENIKAIKLRVSGAFHTPELTDAEQEFTDFLQDIQFQAPVTPVISNLTARPHQSAELKNNLARHLTHPVEWIKSIEFLALQGVNTFTEIVSPAIYTPMIDEIRAQLSQHAPSEALAPKDKPVINSPRWQDSKFCQYFNCNHPLLIGNLYNATSTKLIAALAQQGSLSFLDTDHLSLSALRDELTALRNTLGDVNCFGITLSNDPIKQAEQLQLCKQESVINIHIRGLDTPTAALETFKTQNTQIRWLISLSNSQALTHFYTFADAISIQLSAAESEQQAMQSLFAQAQNMKQLNATEATPFIGVSGIAGSPDSVQSWLTLGAEFVMAGSVFLTSHEANLTEQQKAVLAQSSYSDYQCTADWRYPDLNSQSFSYIINHEIADKNQKISSLYLSSELNELQQIRCQLQDPPFNCQEVPDYQISQPLSHYRQHLSKLINQSTTTDLIPGDSSLVMFNQWLNTPSNKNKNRAYPAGEIANLLCPL